MALHFDACSDTGAVTGRAASRIRGLSADAGWGSPVLLDLDGNGIKITPLSSSNIFYDMAGAQ